MANLNSRLDRIERRFKTAQPSDAADIPEPATLEDARRTIREIIAAAEQRMRSGQRPPKPMSKDDPLYREILVLIERAKSREKSVDSD